MTLEQANQVVELMTAKLAPDAQVIFGARQDPAFEDTIKVMSIITGAAGDRLLGGSMAADLLGDALNIARKSARDEDGLHRFDD
jgi:cell division protein FtsZ